MKSTSVSDWPKHIQEQIKRKEANERSESGNFTDKQVLWVPHLPPGLNGSGGLMNQHWTEYKKLKERWVQYIFALQPDKHEGKVSIKYTRKSIHPMDWDNLGASFKVVGDALIANDVIKDDSPKIINPFEIDWKKADSFIEQGIRIEIKSVE